MNEPKKIAVFQTAFLGDVVLTLPLIQALHEKFPAAAIIPVTIPAAASMLRGHPAVSKVLEYDKRGSLRGFGGMVTMIGLMRAEKFDIALIPHRSLRSAFVCRAAGIPIRIGFRRGMGRHLMTTTVPYDRDRHEIMRNLSLGKPLELKWGKRPLPLLYPSAEDRIAVDELLKGRTPPSSAKEEMKMVAIAPGSVWATKRWPKERYVELLRLLSGEGIAVALVGGEGDRELCASIAKEAGTTRIVHAAGALTILQSAELLGRCAALITNDSAPAHLGVAMRTPVVAIFGPTVPGFGFAPAGPRDRVVETSGLLCRPCAIHGGKKCPIGTLECMHAISAVRVRNEVMAIVGKTRDARKAGVGSH